MWFASIKVETETKRDESVELFRFFVLEVFLLSFLTACATPYQKGGLGGGFIETQLSQNVWKINFNGNQFTKMRRATDFCLLKGAELALENGYKYFTVLNENSHTESSTVTTQPMQFRNKDGSVSYMGGGTKTIHKPRAEKIISMHHEKPFNSGIVYEAELIVLSLGNSYSVESIKNRILRKKEEQLKQQRAIAQREQELREREMEARERERIRRQQEIAQREQEFREGDAGNTTGTSIYAGTGFMFSGKDYVITNWHVIRGMNSIKILFLNGEKINASVLLKDAENDIAFLKLDKTPQLPPSNIRIGDSSKIRMGDEVFTIGYPAYQILGKNPKYSKGEVNALSGINDDPRVLQISVPIQPGNSGGPLFNSIGEVIGITQASLDPKVAISAFGTLPQNVNYAIKSDYISNLLPMLPETMIASRGIVIVQKDPENTLSNFIEKIKKNIVLIEANE
jgi:S1-C subfamily serine protease